MKDRLPESKQEPQKTKFVACNTTTLGGPFYGGSQCFGGLRMFKEMRREKMERAAMDCQCKIDWRKENGL